MEQHCLWRCALASCSSMLLLHVICASQLPRLLELLSCTMESVVLDAVSLCSVQALTVHTTTVCVSVNVGAIESQLSSE